MIVNSKVVVVEPEKVIPAKTKKDVVITLSIDEAKKLHIICQCIVEDNHQFNEFLRDTYRRKAGVPGIMPAPIYDLLDDMKRKLSLSGAEGKVEDVGLEVKNA